MTPDRPNLHVDRPGWDIKDPFAINLVGGRCRCRYHVMLLLQDLGVVGFKDYPRNIRDSQFRKLFTGYSIATYRRLNRVAAMAWDLDDDRTLDVSFVGKTDYSIPALVGHGSLKRCP